MLVIKSLPDHPLGLVPGDIVLGYDGIPWKKIYKEFLKVQFPLSPMGGPVSTISAETHNNLINAGMNWHLFDTLDVVQYSNGDTLHYSTDLLEGQTEFIWANEQLAVPGVPWVDINTGPEIKLTSDFDRFVSWGIVENTKIGYIYLISMIRNLSPDVRLEFYNAIKSLMDEHSLKGLIIDIRLNIGGNTLYPQKVTVHDAGLSLLFNSYIINIAEAIRCGNHFEMCPDSYMDSEVFAIKGDPNTFFDKPIAVLTGPGAQSFGDILTLQMRYHPMARLFGKSPAGAFSGWDTNLDRLGQPGWWFAISSSNGFLVSNPDSFLAHTELPVDEEVWLTQEDVAKGEDTVVKRAMEWIQNLSHAHDVKVDKLYALPGTDEVVITAIVENPNSHELSVEADVESRNQSFNKSIPLFDDGLHSDGNSGDATWGNTIVPNVDEQSYTVSVTTTDHDDEKSRSLPNVAWFTTVGPVQLYNANLPYLEGKYYESRRRQSIALVLYNAGSQSDAKNITATMSTNDPRIHRFTTNTGSFNDIAAGSADTSSGYFFDYAEGYGPETTLDSAINFDVKIYMDNIAYWSGIVNYVTNIDQENEISIPLNFSLAQNYPNPFNPSTTIEFTLPKSEFVELKVYNILGKEVSTLVSNKLNQGNHTYQFNGKNLASGIYYYQLVAGDFREVKKMIILR